jgi:hypothetical protein
VVIGGSRVLVILNGMLTKTPLTISNVKRIIISTKLIPQFKDSEQIIIEDIGLHETNTFIAKGYDSIAYSHKLSGIFLQGVVFKDEKIIMLINGSEGFDLGVSLRILQNISTYETNPNIYLLVEAPPLSSNTFVLGRFYAWIKSILLYDMYFNMKREGSLRIMFFDENQPPQLYRLLVDIIEKTEYEPVYASIIDMRIKRYIFPIVDLIILAKLLTLRGRLEHVINEYKAILLLLNKLLDEGTPELWEIARRDKQTIWSSIFPYKRIVSKGELLDKGIGEAIRKIGGEYSKYTRPAIDVKKLFNLILSGISLSTIYTFINIDEVINSIVNVVSEELVRTYISGHKNAVEKLTRALFVSEDIGRATSLKHINIVKNRVNEIIVIDYGKVVLCEDCGLPSYFPREYEDAYYDRIGIAINTYYPESLKINDQLFKASEIHNMRLLNYNGYVKALRESHKLPYENIFKKLREAAL